MSSIFYIPEESIDKTSLRFGDILDWNTPLLMNSFSDKCNQQRFKIESFTPEKVIVATPCCSIQTKSNSEPLIQIIPLTKVLSNFFSNPYFKEDLLRINLICPPKKQCIPQTWANLPPEEKTRRLASGNSYTLNEFFIYAPFQNCEEYTLINKDRENFSTKHYMINFKNIYSMKLFNIQSPNNILVRSKIAELTPEARRDLIDKLKAFHRLSAEDEALIS